MPRRSVRAYAERFCTNIFRQKGALRPLRFTKTTADRECSPGRAEEGQTFSRCNSYAASYPQKARKSPKNDAQASGQPPPGDGVMNTGSIENSLSEARERAAGQPIISYCSGQKRFCQALHGKKAIICAIWHCKRSFFRLDKAGKDEYNHDGSKACQTADDEEVDV